MTSRYAVLGSPISHSLSPKIHNYIFKQIGSDAEYDSYELSSGLLDFLRSKPGYAGFSLTMPLKDQGYQIAGSHSATALQTRSVNTLLVTESGAFGYNTDVFGIGAALGDAPESVCVLGSGATARSALAAFPLSKKFIYARNTPAATAAAAQYGAELVELDVAIGSDVVISTLPAGVLSNLIPSDFVFRTILDAAYTNKRFEAAHFISGLEMLMQQAIAQQRIFASGDETVPLTNEVGLILGLRALLNMAK